MLKFGMTKTGASFSAQEVEEVWKKGTPIAGQNPDVLRRDACSAVMNRGEYGKTSTFGWEVDHVVALANGGGDELSNLQPMQWQNNRAKCDGPLKCVTTEEAQLFALALADPR